MPTYVVNLSHWLEEDGWPAASVRRQALKIARLVEYGGPLDLGYSRPTLVECSRRANRRPCEGLLWVMKKDGSTIEAWCPECDGEEYVITGWLTTMFADGPMDPIPPAGSGDPPRMGADEN